MIGIARSLLAALAMVSSIPVAATAQDRNYPPISARQFTSGSIQVKVTGSWSMDETIPINTMASIGGGDMTWLQYGASGDAKPNATITFNDTNEVGVIVARGKSQATSGIGGNEKPWCTGKTDVKPTMITGEYTCNDVTSYDTGTRAMGKVVIVVKFTAGS
jgi:hypothetical protein